MKDKKSPVEVETQSTVAATAADLDTASAKPDIDKILRKHNITIDDLIVCGKRGLNCRKVIKDKYGDVVGEVDDMNIQHKFFASFMELLGFLNSSSVNVQVNNISSKERELIEAYKRTLPSGPGAIGAGLGT